MTTITAFKGFDKNLICSPDGKPFQYAVGETYTHDGEAQVCKTGFHACEYPLDVFNYYAPAGNRFAIVEQSGTISRKDGDSKIASSTITVKAEIGIPGLVKAAIEYTLNRCLPIDPSSPASSTGDYGAASSTGTQGAASSTGTQGVAIATGYGGRVMAAETNAIVLVNRDAEGAIRHIRASKVGEKGIVAGCWYTLNDAGEFEVAP